MKYRLHSWITWLRFGRLYERVTDTLDGHLVMEYEVRSFRSGRIVGYWAHGYFDPGMPYTGQPAIWGRK